MLEFRQDPIAGYWVAISKERSHRPIEFARASPALVSGAICPFCPGNEALTPPEVLRYSSADGSSWRVRVFPNKYPALLHEGVHEVIVESTEHRASFGDLPPGAAFGMLAAAQERIRVLKQDARLKYVQLFKNNGPGAGASLEHPHSQLLALPVVPVQLQLELDGPQRHYARSRRCIFCELLTGRFISASEHAVVIVPNAPRFPHETWILPSCHESHFENADSRTLEAVAAALHRTVRCIERALAGPDYNVLLHTAPLQEPPLEHYHWHLEILPRVTGLGGFEFGTGCYINTVSPEESAAILKELWRTMLYPYATGRRGK